VINLVGSLWSSSLPLLLLLLPLLVVGVEGSVVVVVTVTILDSSTTLSFVISFVGEHGLANVDAKDTGGFVLQIMSPVLTSLGVGQVESFSFKNS
jgi:hypothetical protein